MVPPKHGWQARGPRYAPGRNSRGGRGDGEQQKARQPCKNFQQSGQCRFGARCRFSHEQASNADEASSSRIRGTAFDTPAELQAKADYISWKKMLKSPPMPNDIETVRLIWTKALAILKADDREGKQKLPRDLDGDNLFGRQHIRALLEMVAQPGGSSTFVDLACLFLFVITHPALLDCLSVDTSMGSLYNFMSGSNGSRAIPFFVRLIAAMAEYHFEIDDHEAEDSAASILVAASDALKELLRREQRALFHDNLPDLVQSMTDYAQAASGEPDHMEMQRVYNSVREVQGMMDRARGSLHPDEPSQEGSVTTMAPMVTSTYPRDIVMPQDRHDNDKMDFTKIQILPTEDEVRCDLPPFLPSTDFSQPHFLTNTVERHLDTQFRLLRHDVFGELSEALGGVLIALEADPSLLENPRFDIGATRAYYYPRAHISYVSFERRKGLEVQIRFPQPRSLRGKSSSERQKWWEDSKRLEEGILLCMIATDGTHSSLLFLTVSGKIVGPSERADPSSKYGETGVNAKLVTRNQQDLERLVHLSCQKSRGLLVEFPSVLLATFVPILENLQSMQRAGRLPFQSWMLPNTIGEGEQQPLGCQIRPPLYARTPDFRFSLASILTSPSNDLVICPTTSVSSGITVDEVEARTSLDRGQCSALIAALTREFTFIQGPPGCSKSFLGIQLMRVLLSCAQKAHSGPILVM